MVNIKAGVIGAVATFVLILLEAILLPIALSFLVLLNDSGVSYNGSNQSQVLNTGWLTTADRNILAYTGTITVVTILFTFIGGMIGSVFLALKT